MQNQINCTDYGAKELSSAELLENNGGGLIVFAFAAGLALAYYEARIK